METLETAQGRRRSPASTFQKSASRVEMEEAEQQVFLDYVNREIGSLKRAMLSKYQEYEEFKDFCTD